MKFSYLYKNVFPVSPDPPTKKVTEILNALR